MHILILILWVVAVIGVAGFEAYYYLRFKKMLTHPFINHENKVPKTVDALYMLYKKLPKVHFKLAKMKLRSWNKSEIVPQSIDAFIKIIISILLTTTGVVITIMLSSLNIANTNKDSDITQRTDWYNSIST